MKSVCLFAIIFGVVVGLCSAQAQDVAAPAAEDAPEATAQETISEERKAVALRQAEEWLELVDSGKFKQTWDRAAPFLRKHYERSHWSRAMAVSMSPLGAVQTRKVRVVEHHRNMPGGPDRDYIIFRFDTVFKNRPVAEESVTMMWQLHEPRWRVVGYFVK